MSVKLVIVDGPNRGREFPLHDGENVLGRTNETEIELPSTKVSRRHAAIVVEGGQVEIADLGSSNGTFMNGKKVSRSPIPPGAKIIVGEYVLQVVNGGGRQGAAVQKVAAGGPVVAKKGGAVMVVPAGQQRRGGGAPGRGGPNVSVPSEGAKRAADQVVQKIGGFPWRVQIFMIVAAVGLALFLDIAFIVTNAKNDYRDLAASRARLVAQQLGAENGQYMYAKQNLLLSCEKVRDEQGVKDSYLVSADEGLIVCPTALIGRQAPDKVVAVTLKKEPGDFQVETMVNAQNGEYIDIGAPIQIWDREKGSFVLVGVAYVVYAPEEVAKRATSPSTLLGVGAIILAVFGAGGALLMMRATEPAIARLQEDTELLIRGDLKRVQPTLKMKEVEALAHSINRLFEKGGSAAGRSADPMGFAAPASPQLALPAQAGPVDNAGPGASATVKALVSAIPDAVIVVDADSNVVEVNKAAEELFGLSPARVRGKHLLEAITDKDVLNAVLDLQNEVAAAPQGVVQRDITIGDVAARVSAAGVRQGKELAGSAIVFHTGGGA